MKVKNSEWQRIKSKFEKTKFCWLWKPPPMTVGYGQIHFRRKTILAHRLLYQIFVGSIPSELVIDHLCEIRICVNPNHMHLVTRAENTLLGSPFAFRDRCKNGHLYTEENIYHHKNNEGRRCRKCTNEKNTKYRLAKQQVYG